MEILSVNDINDDISFDMSINLFNKELAIILKQALEVDPEFSKQISRSIEVGEFGNLNLNYKSKAINLKPMKKSINGMLENMVLVLQTVDGFKPKI